MRSLMRHTTTLGMVLLLWQGVEGNVRVVATTPDLASIAEAVGGDRVEVRSIAKGYQDREKNLTTTPVGDLEADLEFLMRAARKIEAIREDLGKVGPVIATQVQEAMLGRRSVLHTDEAEEQASLHGLLRDNRSRLRALSKR